MKRKIPADERQIRDLLWIEHHGYWLMFWSLVLTIFVQAIRSGPNIEILGGELITLAIGSFVMCWGSVKKGVWTFCDQPRLKTNLLGSLAATLLGTLLIVLTWPLEVPGVWFYIVAAVIIFIITFGILTLMGNAVKRKTNRMVDEIEDDNE